MMENQHCVYMVKCATLVAVTQDATEIPLAVVKIGYATSKSIGKRIYHAVNDLKDHEYWTKSNMSDSPKSNFQLKSTNELQNFVNVLGIVEYNTKEEATAAENVLFTLVGVALRRPTRLPNENEPDGKKEWVLATVDTCNAIRARFIDLQESDNMMRFKDVVNAIPATTVLLRSLTWKNTERLLAVRAEMQYAPCSNTDNSSEADDINSVLRLFEDQFDEAGLHDETSTVTSQHRTQDDERITVTSRHRNEASNSVCDDRDSGEGSPSSNQDDDTLSNQLAATLGISDKYNSGDAEGNASANHRKAQDETPCSQDR